MSLTDEPRCGRPSFTDDTDTVKKVEALLQEDRRVTIQMVMHETSLSYGGTWNIIHNQMHIPKVSARWVPRLLTPLQRQTRRDMSRQEQDEDKCSWSQLSEIRLNPNSKRMFGIDNFQRLMHLQWIVTAMIGMGGIRFLMTSKPKTNRNVIKAAGPGMCERFYRQRKKCPSDLDTIIDHSCRLLMGNSSLGSHKEEKFTQIFRRLHAKKNLSCSDVEKHTSDKNMDCQRSQSKQIRRKTYTRFVMLPFGTKNEYGRQLYLHNDSVVLYPHVWIQRVAAVAYIAATRKLVIANAEGKTLLFMSLDGEAKTEVSERHLVSGITVDEKNLLMFLALFRSRKIKVMTIEGNHLRFNTMIHLKGNPTQTAADPQRKVIYVVAYIKYIAKYDYKGILQRILVKGEIRDPLSLNSRGDVLYYLQGYKEWTLFKMFLSNLTSYAIPTKFRPNPYHFYVYSDALYFTPYSKRKRTKLHVLSDSGKEIAAINTGYDIDVEYVVVCAIP